MEKNTMKVPPEELLQGSIEEGKSTREANEIKCIMKGLGIEGKGFTITKDKYDNIVIVKYPKNMGKSYLLGIDEAGRGPLAGYLVYSMVFWEHQPENTLYNDSKKVGVFKRTVQCKDLCMDESVGMVVYCLSAKFITINMINNMNDIEMLKQNRRAVPAAEIRRRKIPKIEEQKGNLFSYMKRDISEDSPPLEHKNISKKCPLSEDSYIYISRHRRNLNELSLWAVEESLSKHVAEQIPISSIYMDVIGDSHVCRDILRRAMIKSNTLCNIVVENKADSTYQVVSAASIIAKVFRDALISPEGGMQKLLYGQEYKEIGSGYPSDQISKEWLKNAAVPIFGYPSIVRCSWKPVLVNIKEKMDLLKKKQGKGSLRIPFYKGA